MLRNYTVSLGDKLFGAGGGRRRDKRRRAEPAATPSPRARRSRRAVNYNVSEPDDDDDAPMREKLIKWKLSGCTVAVTLVMVPDP